MCLKCIHGGYITAYQEEGGQSLMLIRSMEVSMSDFADLPLSCVKGTLLAKQISLIERMYHCGERAEIEPPSASHCN